MTASREHTITVGENFPSSGELASQTTGHMTASREHTITVGENFPSSGQAGPTRPGRAAACSGYALAPAPLRERAGRLARDTGL
jgi:hypothetical protein